MRRRRRRDVAPPPSSRRRYTPRSYSFAVAASLIRTYHLTPSRAQDTVEKWRRAVEARMREGKTAASTAEHLHRWESQRLATPYTSRDQSRDRRIWSAENEYRKEIDGLWVTFTFHPRTGWWSSRIHSKVDER